MIRFNALLAICFFSICSSLCAAEAIYWQIYHRPPGIFTKGEHDGQGFVQLALKQVIEKLPQYEHNMVTSSLARALSDIKNAKHVCHPALFKTPERQEFAYFSNAIIVHPTNRIVMRKSLAKSLSAAQTQAISLTSLLLNEAMTFALIEKRLFGDRIDAIMAKVDLGDRLQTIPSENLGSMLSMVALGRADITIAYPFEIEHFNSTIKHDNQRLVAFPIDGVTPYSMGHVACPKTDWGYNVIKDINNILDDVRDTSVYMNAVTSWWRDEAANSAFQEYYRSTFLNN